MEQHVDAETHSKGNILDLILSNKDDMVSEVNMEGKIGGSDHEMIQFKININESRSNSVKEFRDYGRADWKEMRAMMSKDWTNILAGKDVNEMWQILKSTINDAIDKFVPMRKSKEKIEPKWMNNQIRKQIAKKKASWAKWKKSKREMDKREYKQIERETKKMIRNSKNRLERDIAKDAKTNPKRYFSYLNSGKKVKTKVGPLINAQKEYVIDPKQQANILNDFYSSVFTRSVDEVPVKEKMCEEELSDIEITAERVKSVIDGLKENTAPGPDGIPTKLTKALKNEIAEPLAILFRKSMDSGKIPDEWRNADVTAIHKGGARLEPGNYRGVTLSCGYLKMLERMVKDEGELHIERNMLMSKSQHGFRSGKSTQTNLIEFMNQTTKWLDEGRKFDIIYLDFAKAFDKVCHKRLMVKLKAAGIAGKVLKWIEDLLSGRKQRVKVEGKYSEWADVISGVMQGSVLGGTLFNLFVDDIDEAIRIAICRAIMAKFADDTKAAMIVENEDDAKAMQELIDELSRWAEKWGMVFNAKKCKVMHVGLHNAEYEYYMDGNPIEKVTEEKDVGVWVSKSLKPTKQCEVAAAIAHSTLRRISKSFHYRKSNVLVPLFKSFVRPQLEFSVAAWSPWTEQDVETLEGVQRSLIRLISNKRGNTYEERLRNAGLTTLRERRLRGDMIETFKVVKGFTKVDKNEWFVFRNPDETRRTRSTASISDQGSIEMRSDVMFRENVNLEIRRNFFNVRVVKEWNQIPDVVKSAATINAFKNAYDNWKRTTNENNS